MKQSYNLTFHLVTHRENLTMERFFAIVQQAVNNGVSIVQLREKNTPKREVIQIGRRLLEILRPLAIPLIINDYVDIAAEIGAEGVHIGQSDAKVKTARAILGAEAMIGLSIESIEQALKVVDQEVTYLSASPLFPSITKLDCKQPWRLEQLRQICTLSQRPIIGIGGINQHNIATIGPCGIAGVAISSAIFKAPCPALATRQIAERLRHAIC